MQFDASTCCQSKILNQRKWADHISSEFHQLGVRSGGESIIAKLHNPEKKSQKFKEGWGKHLSPDPSWIRCWLHYFIVLKSTLPNIISAISVHLSRRIPLLVEVARLELFWVHHSALLVIDVVRQWSREMYLSGADTHPASTGSEFSRACHIDFKKSHQKTIEYN